MSDEKLTQTEEEIIQKIKKDTIEDYNSQSTKNDRKSLIVTILMSGIIVLLVLIVSTLIKSTDAVNSIKTGKEVIELQLDDIKE